MDFTEYLLKENERLNDLKDLYKQENEKLQKTSLKTTIEKLIDENQQLKKEKEEINNDCLRLVKEYNTIKQENSQLKELSEQFKHDLQYTEHHIVNELKQENEKLKEYMKEETFYYQWQNCIDENEKLTQEKSFYKNLYNSKVDEKIAIEKENKQLKNELFNLYKQLDH